MTGAPRTILACVAHADDEILGCGGTLARHAAAGDRVAICIVADGVTSRTDKARQPEELEKRRESTHTAARIIGATTVHFLNFEDQRLDTMAILDITQTIERVLSEIAPDVIYTHHIADMNRDHCIVAEATLTATRPMPGQKVRAVFGFETLSSTEWALGKTTDRFMPTRYVEITNWLETKIAALDAYRYEMRAFPHARSLEAARALAQFRGSNVGVMAAEAFSVYRQIVTDNDVL